MPPRSIAAVNMLPQEVKTAIYSLFVPSILMDRFGIGKDLRDAAGRPLLEFRCMPGATDVVLALRRRVDDADPILYSHLTDTVTGHVRVLLYVVNDPDSPRFDVDRMPDGTPTEFGSSLRNLEAEHAAMNAGLAPGQVRRGLRILKQSIEAFEQFVQSLGQDLYFVEPLYYHNAVIFERYGFAYQKGRRLMSEIDTGFSPHGVLTRRLDGNSPFRQPGQPASIRGRSWAIHDGILGHAFTEMTMYKRVGQSSAVDTAPGVAW